MARSRPIEQTTKVAKSRDKAKPRLAAGPEARKGVAAGQAGATGRRRRVEPAARVCDVPTPEAEFMHAMQEYKKSSGRMFPTWSEVLEVLQALGYRKPGQEAAAPAPVSESA